MPTIQTSPHVSPPLVMQDTAHEGTLLTHFLCVDRITRSMVLRAQHAYDAQRSVLWIEGAVGVGKSLLMDCIIERDAQQHGYISSDKWQHITLSEEHVSSTLERLHHLWTNHTHCILHMSDGLSLSSFHHYADFLCTSHAHRPTLTLIESRTLGEQEYPLREPLYQLKHHLLDHAHQHIVLAPLHYRPHDVAYYIMHYLECCAEMMHLPHTPYLSASVMEWLQTQRWTDNIRSLQILCLTLCQQRQLHVHHREEIASIIHLSTQHHDALASSPPTTLASWNLSLTDEATGKIRPLHIIEREIISRLYHHHKRCKSNTSRDLGIGRTTLYRKLKEHDIA